MYLARHRWALFVAAPALIVAGCSGNAATPEPPAVAVSIESTSESSRSQAPEPRVEPEQPLIEMTSEAQEMIRKATAELPPDDGWVLRLRASWPENVCSPQYQLAPARNEPTEETEVFESAGFRFEILKRQKEMLRGVRLHYGKMGSATGLMFDNPKFKGELLKTWEPVLAADPLSKS